MRHYPRNIVLFLSISCLFAGVLRAQTSGADRGIQNYVINGNNVASGTYPWMVALVSSGAPTPYAGQFCGGSLIDRFWVVTAAHCIEDITPADLEIWAGLTNLTTPGANAEMRTVRAIYIHPTRNAFGFEGDIALLLLDSPIDTIAPVTYSQDPVAIGVGDTARAIGWGLSQVSPPQSPNILQFVDLDIISNTTASQGFGVPLVGAQYLAAGRNGFDTCFGDSGGPLFDPMNAGVGGPLLYGVTSFGVGCPADASLPGIYANAGHFAGWLNTFLAQPTGPDPDVSVINNGLVIASGSAASKTAGTDFGKRIKGGKKKTKTFYLSNAAGTIPLNVYNVTVTGRGFTLQSDPPVYVLQGAAEPIKVRARAPKKKRTLRGTVLVTTSDPAEPAYAFSLKAKSKKKKKRRRSFFRF